MTRLQLGVLLFAAATGSCVIIVQPSTPPPVIIPEPLTCINENNAPTAHIIFDMRLERSTVNLKGIYSNIMLKTAGGLTAAGILPTTAVLVRADERPVPKHGVLAAWGCQLDDPSELTPERVIEHYAKQVLEPGPIGCVTDPLVGMGRAMSDVTTDYPNELPGRSGVRVFGSAPDIVLVVHFDERARRSAYNDAACSGAHSMGAADDDERALWLAYAGGAPPAAKVIHWFFTTDEAIDREHFVAGCKGFEGFPTSTLDVLEPSANVVYGPLTDDIGNSGQTVVLFPLCGALTDHALNPFMLDEIPRIAAIAGTGVDLDVLSMILAGGMVGETPPPTGGEGS